MIKKDYNNKIILEILVNIEKLLESIIEKFEELNLNHNFLCEKNGLLKQDAVFDKLLEVENSFKEINRLGGSRFFSNYNHVPWNQVEITKNVLSYHHYNLDPEIIFEVCKKNITELLNIIKNTINNLSTRM